MSAKKTCVKSSVDRGQVCKSMKVVEGKGGSSCSEGAGEAGNRADEPAAFFQTTIRDSNDHLHLALDRQ